MEENICIVVVAGGDFFQDYIPIFIYSVLKSYPNYTVIVYVVGRLKNHLIKSIDLLKSIGTFIIKENAISKILDLKISSDNEFKIEKDYLDKKLTSKLERYLRWIIIDEDLMTFKYIYFGDIDIFIVPEKLSLLEQHKNHMTKTNLCYSNKLRDATQKFDRLTGLHFIKTKEYFEKTRNVIEKYQNMIKNRNLNIDNDEKLLYKIIFESDLEMISRNEDFRPNHGIHFGLFKSFSISYLNETFSHFKSYAKPFLNMIKDKLFIQIFKNIKHIEMKVLILRAKWNYKKKVERIFYKKFVYFFLEVILTLLHFLLFLKNKTFRGI